MMPIPRNWSEELVSEWLSLKGYSTEIGLPVGTSSRGGRKEADVVGYKVIGVDVAQTLEICHVEVGQLGGYNYNLQMLQDKFSDSRIKEVEQRYRKRLTFEGAIKYKKLYIDIWERPKRVDKLMSDTRISGADIEVWTPSKFFNEVFKEINNWGESTIPESHWLLKMLEAMIWSGMIRF
jgi:hypothetical protein